MSPVDETLEVVVKPKRTTRRRALTTIDASTEAISVPQSRASRKRKAATDEPIEAEVVAVVVPTEEKPKRTRTKKTKKPKEVDETTTPKKKKTGTTKTTKNTKKGKETEVAVSETKTAERRAPTPLAAEKATVKTLRRQLMVVALLLCVGVGASAAVGQTDKGPIDVSHVIAERNDRISRGEEQGEIVSTQSSPQLPDGGLIGLGVNGPTDGTVPVPATATSTASTTPPAGNIPLTNAEAEAAAAAFNAGAASSTAQ